MDRMMTTRPGHPRPHSGFTLIELMVTILIVAILAAIALPTYRSFIDRSRVRVAGADLTTLAAALENRFQRQLAYPTATTATTATTKALVSGWEPAETLFVYSANSTNNTYTLTATGSGPLTGCTLTLNNLGVRGPASLNAACGGLTSW